LYSFLKIIVIIIMNIIKYELLIVLFYYYYYCNYLFYNYDRYICVTLIPSDRGAGSNVSPSSQSWLYPNLRVRVIDETYMKGKYFKEKVRVTIYEEINV